MIKIALAGNPNSGKTTLFNALTGSNQYVGNWPGVTVEKKEGKLLAAILDVLEDIALDLEDLWENTVELAEGLDVVSDDLEDVEDIIYDEFEDEDEDEFDEDTDLGYDE